jgi:hypothetical protein
MSRFHEELSGDVTITTGDDHALGRFMQVSDQRYARSGEDEQGEGYVLNWDQVFGFSTNLIGATREQLGDNDKILELCNEFARSLAED